MMRNEPYYDIVFVVLVYKNIDVLRSFFASLSLQLSYHVIVVNSFYDKISEDECRLIANENGAEFIPILNEGFGVGNNIGCKYAIEHYRFRFLILSNSDILIHELDCLCKINHEKAVYAADVRMENGHRQNPHLPFRVGLYLRILDLSYRMKSEALMSVAFALNRILREFVVLRTKLNGGHMVRIFSAHGSFIIFTYQAALALSPIFHEGMFLYNEELYLAHRCRMLHIPVYYVPRIKIIHMEGASSDRVSTAWKIHEDSYFTLASWMKEHHLI